LDSETSTVELIHKACEGDRRAFDLLAERLAPRLGAVVRSLAGAKLAAKIEAQDLLQETFLQAWRSLDRFRGKDEEEFWRWLTAVAHNVVLMQARKLGAKKRAGAEVPLPEQGSSSGSLGQIVDILRQSAVSPSTALRRDERFDRLRKALGKLSPDHRKVIFLTHIRELNTAEVARRMDRSPEAISMLLYRALLKLKDAFGETDSVHLPERSLEDEENSGPEKP
jgi:RNA polymerase sigma-70 factor (ECF subfamily)